MQIDLTGKTAIVTGSTQGIGLGIAKGLAAAGAEVVVNGRSEDSVSEALAALKDAAPGAQATGFARDLGTAEGCEDLVAAHPGCDILVNNLGVFGTQDFFEIPDAEWTRYFETNVMSGVRLSRAYLPAMEKNGWGRVVFLSSESGFNIPEAMIHYGFSKTAVMSVARGLAKRMAGTGVTVNSVLPGPTLTEGIGEMLRERMAESGRSLEEEAAAFAQEARPSTILRRAATVEEVANMVVYACSPQASATTGASLRVEGGIVDTL